MSEERKKCDCLTHKGTHCTKKAAYKMVLKYNNEPFYCCTVHARPYLDRTRSYYYEVKNIEKI